MLDADVTVDWKEFWARLDGEPQESPGLRKLFARPSVFEEDAVTSIVTYTGVEFDPLHPDPDWLDIRDIAHSLSNQCRFTGHTSEYLSVAQHSIHVSEILPYELKLWGLLHDASEAYMSDIARPLKYSPGLGEMYREVEENLMRCISERWELEWPMPAEVHAADDALLRAEIRDLMPTHARFDHDTEGEVYEHKITPWPTRTCEWVFHKRFCQLRRRDER